MGASPLDAFELPRQLEMAPGAVFPPKKTKLTTVENARIDIRYIVNRVASLSDFGASLECVDASGTRSYSIGLMPVRFR